MEDRATGKLKVQEADRRLADMAKYEATKGGLVSARRCDVVRLFREMKRLVIKGSEDLDELEAWVLGRWGYPQTSKFTLESVGIREPTQDDLVHMPKAELCGEPE